MIRARTRWRQAGPNVRSSHASTGLLSAAAAACHAASQTLHPRVPGCQCKQCGPHSSACTWKGSCSAMLCAQVRAEFMPYSCALRNASSTASLSLAAGDTRGEGEGQCERPNLSVCVSRQVCLCAVNLQWAQLAGAAAAGAPGQQAGGWLVGPSRSCSRATHMRRG